ncbi:SWI/SNF-related matrix-associated actin-dependent regulator of chromatin subfamily A containing DEAD/H box 1 [Papilio machaon]|uniref:SWI/SNF-related matrix-associated actin-dependent regulator of chromatin subfamily A containing DEAD/H box 1 homolog n=1 Tax=Papilio machaon TaxID=76193 RepID=A0A0N1PJH2_PAPMA|nr:SWI/SNF-related matrix-associated actin-dependent regulator of chromatin subfamily A containing DEAD/H box 1 [Papilio machaon]
MSESTSPSVLSYLRQYRFQRKPNAPGSSGTVTIAGPSSNSQSLIRMPAPVANRNGPIVYKRIRILDSDSDDSASPAKKPATSQVELTTAVKERRFRNMLEMFPEISPMLIKNTLVKKGWNEERTRDELLKYDPETDDKGTSSNFISPRPSFSGNISRPNGNMGIVRVTSGGPITIVKKALASKGGRARRGSSGSEDEDYGVRKGKDDKVYDSLKLAPYQLVGLNWLAVLHKQGVSGILADEMGLGKTVQVIAFLAHLKETGQARGTHLIVVPASTLDNWSGELARWCPSLRVSKYYGNPEERRQMRVEYARGLDNIDVVLTTYTMVSSCPEERKMFRITSMHYVIYDEAHMLKNMSTQRYDNLLRIKSKHRLLLTGTPLQNNLLELMSLLCFVMPHMFSGKTDDLKSLFQKNAKVKTAKKTNGTTNPEDDVPAFEESQITQAKRIMKPFVLRRLKRDVLQDLPKKTNHTELCPLSGRQEMLYKNLIAAFSAKDGTIHATTEQSGLSMMMDMRKLANHPLLLRYHYTEPVLRKIAARLVREHGYKEKNEQYAYEDLLCMSDFQIHQLTLLYPSIRSHSVPDHLILDSGKFQKLDEMLPRLKAEGHRVLVFSQFTMMLDILEPYLKLRRYRYLRLDGSTAVTDRQELIDQYNAEDIFVFLLSTRAGGLGINLTAADTVIIHDIDFNPYNDKQAEDR